MIKQTNKQSSSCPRKPFHPPLATYPFTIPWKFQDLSHLQLLLLFSWPANFLPPLPSFPSPSLAIFKAFISCYSFRKKNTFLDHPNQNYTPKCWCFSLPPTLSNNKFQYTFWDDHFLQPIFSWGQGLLSVYSIHSCIPNSWELAWHRVSFQ